MSTNNRKGALEILYPADAAEERTYICFGVPRGGTSAVAGTIQRLGIFLGDDLPNNYEDPNFLHKGVVPMRKTVEERNETHPIWGWKVPAAANYLEALLPTVRNPHFIVVYRDIVATMRAHMRWHNRSQLLAVHEIMMQQQKNWFLIDRWKVPTAMVSYEKAILTPELFVSEMADFLHVDQPEGAKLKDIVSFLTPGSYK